ncbi:MAG: hypothetical protein HFJ50_06295 [Clostridia bacterium]|jgi:DNA polymerase III delta prime subunit|nr:hypothetical protein [Clostridia bacterium]
MKNKQIEELLSNAIENKRIINGYIFSGISKKTGNYKYAKEFAKMILCLNKEGTACNNCKACLMFDEGNHSDYYEINKETNETIKVDEIREMQMKILEKPITSEKKVYIINHAENMTKEAQNCLLKTLEEPPEFVTIILVSNNDNNILITIKSRCAKIQFTEESFEEFTEDEKERYNALEEIFGNVDKYSSVDLLNKIEILYKDKDNILENLEFINMILFEKSKSDVRYLGYIDYIEETKRKLKANSNFDMCIDNMILKIWE